MSVFCAVVIWRSSVGADHTCPAALRGSGSVRNGCLPEGWLPSGSACQLSWRAVSAAWICYTLPNLLCMLLACLHDNLLHLEFVLNHCSCYFSKITDQIWYRRFHPLLTLGLPDLLSSTFLSHLLPPHGSMSGADLLGPPRTGSGPYAKFFSGPSSKVGPVKNRRGWLSVAVWLGVWTERVNLRIPQLMLLPRKTKTYAKLSGIVPSSGPPVPGNSCWIPPPSRRHRSLQTSSSCPSLEFSTYPFPLKRHPRTFFGHMKIIYPTMTPAHSALRNWNFGLLSS